MVGESHRQGSSTGDAGAKGVLDGGFPGVCLSYTRIRTHFAVLDADSTSIIFHQRKMGPYGPILVGGDGMLSEFALPLDFTLLSACIFLNYRPE